MTIEEMQRRRKALGYTYETLSDLSGVPIGTVQKILGGFTKSPRYDTVKKLEDCLLRAEQTYDSTARLRTAIDFGLLPHAYEIPKPVLLRETADPYGEYQSGSSAYQFSEDETADDVYPLLPYKKQGTYTPEDRDHLPEDVRTELIDGVIYDMASPSAPHQIIAFQIALQLQHCIDEQHRDCILFPAPFDMEIKSHFHTNRFQPDLLIACDASKIKTDNHEGAAAFVLEILSPSTRQRDLTLKAWHYQKFGVQEYWVVDPKRRTVTVHDYKNDPSDEEPAVYSFTDSVPVALSGGACTVDFQKISDALARIGQ